MDALNSVIIEVAKCFVGPIKRQAKPLTDYKVIKKDLLFQFVKLVNLQQNVSRDVQEAENNGKTIIQVVKKWLDDTKVSVDEVNSWKTRADIAEMNASCCGCSSNCCQRYKLGKEGLVKRDLIIKQIQCGLDFSRVTEADLPKGIDLIPSEDFTPFNSVQKTVNETIKALQNSSKRIIGVVGMGGIGKTTIVTEIAKTAKRQSMFDEVVFAVVSASPDIGKIQGQLGDMLGLTFTKESSMGRADQLKERIARSKKTFLVVLDDVWSRINLGEIGIPFNAACKVLLTTRREQVCEIMSCDETIQVKLLEDDEAWDLFKINAGIGISDSVTQLEEVAKQMIKECKNLPLALVVVARALKGKSLEEWILAVERLQRSKLTDLEDAEHNVYACLRLSYDYLKADHTKKCFLMCSLFPEDYEINIEELAEYAMGFGLFPEASTFASVKSRLVITLKDLKASSLLLKTENMAQHVKMHDMLRDAALWITCQDEHPFIVPTPLDSNWIRDNQNFGEAIAISLLAFPKNDQFPSRQHLPKLKILLVSQRVPLKLSPSCFECMPALQVLDFTAAKYRLELVLPSSLKHLHNLRTLLLRKWKLKGDISIIGKLHSLEILSFSRSLVTELPSELVELSELRILDLSGCVELENSYTQMLSCLQKIETIHFPNVLLPASDDDEEE